MMSRDEEVIRVVFTREDVADIAADNEIELEIALHRAYEWSNAIEQTATELVNTQLQSVIISNQP